MVGSYYFWQELSYLAWVKFWSRDFLSVLFEAQGIFWAFYFCFYVFDHPCHWIPSLPLTQLSLAADWVQTWTGDLFIYFFFLRGKPIGLCLQFYWLSDWIAGPQLGRMSAHIGVHSQFKWAYFVILLREYVLQWRETSDPVRLAKLSTVGWGW